MKNLATTLLRGWSCLALLLALLFSMPIGYGLAQGTKVVIDPSSREMAVEATAPVDVVVENVTGLYGVEIHLTFDPALLEVVDVDPDEAGVQILPGEFLSPDVVVQNAVDQAAGRIDLSVSQMLPNEPVSGEGVLATILFLGKVAGTSAINFDSVLLSNQDGEPISADIQGGSVIVVLEETPTPTVTSTSEPTPTPTFTPTPGPTATSTPTPGPTPTITPSATPISTGDILGYHTVQPGETLYCIGRAYGVDPYAIARQNSILNPNLIYPGQVLAIPNIPRSLPIGRVCPRQFDGGAPTPACRWYHTVVTGENLYRISLRYGVSMWAIAEANHIFNLHYIQIGQVLCIP